MRVSVLVLSVLVVLAVIAITDAKKKKKDTSVKPCKVKNCAICKPSGKKCKRCNDGFKEKQKGKKCKDACPFDNCNTCDKKGKKCTDCATGYESNGKGCTLTPEIAVEPPAPNVLPPRPRPAVLPPAPGPIDDPNLTGWGFLESYSMPGKCVDVDGNPGTRNDANIRLWDCEKSSPQNSDQLWKHMPNGQLISRPSGKCMDVAGWCRGGNIAIVTCEAPGTRNSDHFWTFDKSGTDGVHFAIKNNCINQCLDVDGWSNSNNGRQIHTVNCEHWGKIDNQGWFASGGATDHFWKFVPVTLNY
jgi:hypothetical protein